MLFFLTILFFTRGAAFPIPDVPRPVHMPDVLACGDNSRSIIEILWSCLTVIAASTWVCVHPNVTGYQTTWWDRLKARLKQFGIAVFAPEVVAMFAFFQRRGSQTLYRDVEARAKALELRSGQRAWTYAHAHFVQMGGIVFKHGEVTYFADPTKWEDEQVRDFFKLELTEAAVLDKSKGDELAKALVILQVLWFVTQSIARAGQSLALTLLEAICLAFTAFNLSMYYFWWDKPLNVACPFEVACQCAPAPHTGSGDDAPDNALIKALLFFFPTDYETLSDTISFAGSWPTGLPVLKSFPTFYWCSKNADDFTHSTLNTYATVALVIASSSFGALHAIAWGFPFPTQGEQILWRCSCLTLTFYPVGHFLLFLLSPLILSKWFKRCVPYLTFLETFVLVLGAVCYIAARLVLIILPFLQLRLLPHTANHAVTCARYLPHI